MSRFQVIIGAVALVAVLSVGGFLHMTRDIAAPSLDIQSSVEQLETSDTSGSEVVFRISQDESQAEYNIYELLNGEDKTVVGTTTEVAGDVLINLNNPAASQVGEIQINARTLATDDDRRDNAVARYVLQSEVEANEFITFQPASISGLPDSISVGDTVDSQVTGDLTVAGVTQVVTFDVSVSLVSEEQITGHAEANILRANFNLTVPDVPFVANVGNEVTLKLDFVAHAVSDAASANT